MTIRSFPALALAALVIVGAFASVAPPPARADVAPAAPRASDIDTSAPWRAAVYRLAHEKFVHPAWGWQHAERNYRLARELAAGDGLPVDDDVLFAACFLHDMAAFPPYERAGVEHGDRAAETSEAVLRDAGFPMRKYAAVAAAERTHMYDRTPGAAAESIVLHDADSLDFLGAIGAARIIALAGDKAPSVASAVMTLRGFAHDIPPHLVTRTARKIGVERTAELTALLDRIDAESDAGAAL
jgi:uncharacterized protein